MGEIVFVSGMCRVRKWQRQERGCVVELEERLGVFSCQLLSTALSSWNNGRFQSRRLCRSL